MDLTTSTEGLEGNLGVVSSNELADTKTVLSESIPATVAVPGLSSMQGNVYS